MLVTIGIWLNDIKVWKVIYWTLWTKNELKYNKQKEEIFFKNFMFVVIKKIVFNKFFLISPLQYFYNIICNFY